MNIYELAACKECNGAGGAPGHLEQPCPGCGWNVFQATDVKDAVGCIQSGKLIVEETRYGFRWGPVSIRRVVSHKGHVVVELVTDRERLTARVTPTGFIRDVERVKL